MTMFAKPVLRAIGVGLCLFLALPPARRSTAEQQTSSSGAFHETAAVHVVEIPVNVIGKDGKPVAGLTAADFDLYDDGKKQTITGMDVIDLSRAVTPSPGAAVATPVEGAAIRHWLIIFDLSYTSLSGLLRARDGAREFVTKAMRPTDLA